MTRSILTLASLSLVLGACSEPARVAAPAANDAMMEMDMPDGTPVDMAAVPMFPGATMVDMKIMPHMPDDAMNMNFDAPAAPGAVRDWYADTLAKKGFTLTPNAQGLAGTDPAGKPFALILEAAPGGHTLGTISKG